jgi:hypothetical protein
MPVLIDDPLKILFFTPHVALWVHTAPEVYLAKSLAELGHSVSYMTCGRAQHYCAPMTARRLAAGCSADEADSVCRACETGVANIQRFSNFEMFRLVDWLSLTDRKECDEVAEEAVNQKNLDLVVAGVSVGKVALYEFTLAHKKMSTELTISQWAEYQIYLSNALLTMRAFARYLEKHTPDVIATFSPQYSNINSCMQLAIAKGIKVLFMESGTNLSHRLGTMRVWDWGIHKLVNPALQYWNRSALNPVSTFTAQAVTGHFRQLLSGQHFAVFSAPYSGSTGIRNKWPISSNQKVLLMTLSSYDEAYAALLIDAFPQEKVFSDVFKTQAEWVKATIEWVRERPDLFLVIRVHPRDFPNKREQGRSEQSYMLEGLLRDVPENVHVNWPSEAVSLYELLEDTDVILTGWSVTAMEGLILGIPIVTYDEKLPSYPRDIMWTGRSENDYYQNIDNALRQGWSIENVVNGYRWLAYNFVDCTICVSEHFGDHELANRTEVQKLWTRVKNKFPLVGQPIDLMQWRRARDGARIVERMLTENLDSIPSVRAAQRPKNIANELNIIKKELDQLHSLLYSNSKLPENKAGLSKNIRTYLRK